MTHGRFALFEWDREIRKPLERSWHGSSVSGVGSSLPGAPRAVGGDGEFINVLQPGGMCFHLADRCSALCGAGTRADAPLSSESRGQTAGSWPPSGERCWIPSIFSNIFFIRKINENDLRGDTGKILLCESYIPLQKNHLFFFNYYYPSNPVFIYLSAKQQTQGLFYSATAFFFPSYLNLLHALN